MQNENVENQPQRNPSRDNRNISSGQNQGNEERGNEKKFGSTDTNRAPEINPGKLDRNEIDLDRSGIDNSEGGESANFTPDEESSFSEPGEEGREQGLQNSRGAAGSNSQSGSNTQTQQAQQQRPDVKNPSDAGAQKNFGNQADGQRDTRQNQSQKPEVKPEQGRDANRDVRH